MTMAHLLTELKRVAGACLRTADQCFIGRTAPAVGTLAIGSVADLSRSKAALVAENTLLRHQLIVLRRQVARPRLTALDRFLLVVLASKARFWRSALLIVQPETLLRWHRLGFRLCWKVRSRPATTTPRACPPTS